MDRYEITLVMETDMSEGKVEEFAHEIVDELDGVHVFPNEELKVVKVERKDDGSS